MNKSEITKLEKEGIERNKRNLRLLKLNLEYNRDLVQKQKESRDFDDKWREYLREQKDLEDSNVLKAIESELKMTEEAISNSTNQLKKSYPAGVG